MSNFVPEKEHLRHALLFLFTKKKKTVELLDDDPTQTQQQLAKVLNVSQETISRRLRATGKINKLCKWIPHDLNERCKVTCEMLLQRHERKSFLYRIVMGDEKWIYFENLKWKKPWLSPGEADSSTPRPNRFGHKTMLCVWWEQRGIVYYELLKPSETTLSSKDDWNGPEDMAK
ncbi:mariner Mos1 transposase [Trichonephila clavipes]|nr:mariner Mos1 transposase [Trichonephila clavipes]